VLRQARVLGEPILLWVHPEIAERTAILPATWCPTMPFPERTYAPADGHIPDPADLARRARATFSAEQT
jgi:hypothetical protein